MPQRPDRQGRIHRGPRAVAWALLCFGLVLTLISGPAGGATVVTITDVSIEGNGVVKDAQDLVLWHGGASSLSVDIETGTGEGAGHYDVCLSIRTEAAEESRLGCSSRLLQGNRPTTVTFNRNGWPSDHLGRGILTVTIRADTLADEIIDRSTVPVVILDRAGDYDGDGLANEREFDAGTAFDRADSDGDDVVDGLELDPYGTDPAMPDTDSDGLNDGVELHFHRTDPTAVDTDGDGLHDRVELREHGTNPNRIDTDGDGLDDAAELNAHSTDPLDPDTDGDGLGDAAEVTTHHTDPTAKDTDDDGLGDTLEVHAFSTSPSAVDTDGDGLDDGAEVHQYQTDPTTPDTDRDGLDDGPEVNDHGTDPNAIDTDGDGLHDGPEITRFGLDPTAVDSDGDGVPDGKEVSRPLPPTDPIVILLVVGSIGLAGWWVLSRKDLGTDTSTGGEPAESSAGSTVVEQPDPTPPLTNEDRIIALLEKHGGRIKQSRIVEETEWSKSTVSRVLSRMEEADQISKISLGRGNLITLPGAEPKRSRPPFDTRKRSGQAPSSSNR